MQKNLDMSIDTFKKSFKAFLTRLTKKIDSSFVRTKKFTGDSVKLENNVVHIRVNDLGVKNLTIKFPDGDFVSSVIFSTANKGNIVVNFDDPHNRLVFIGSGKLEFFPAETWELNIHNGRVAGARLYNVYDLKKLGG